MPQFAANLTLMYNEYPFTERFAAAADDDFDAVEFLFPYDHPSDSLARHLEDAGLTLALFNLPPGDWHSGERGIACHPGREDEFASGLETALDYARTLGCRRLHVMAGLLPATASVALAQATYINNLRYATQRAASEQISLMIEPINTRDMPGYFLQTQTQAHAVLAEVGATNLRMQMDFYHCQIMEGDLASRLRRYLPDIGHIQIAGVPDRHEPDIGEVNYPYLLNLLDELGYNGVVGCEYRPRGNTSAGLDWLRNYRGQRGQMADRSRPSADGS